VEINGNGNPSLDKIKIINEPQYTGKTRPFFRRKMEQADYKLKASTSWKH